MCQSVDSAPWDMGKVAKAFPDEMQPISFKESFTESRLWAWNYAFFNKLNADDLPTSVQLFYHSFSFSEKRGKKQGIEQSLSIVPRLDSSRDLRARDHDWWWCWGSDIIKTCGLISMENSEKIKDSWLRATERKHRENVRGTREREKVAVVETLWSC
jgi:hypothetical protein